MVSCDDFYDGGGRFTNIGTSPVRTQGGYSGIVGSTGFSNYLGLAGSYISNYGGGYRQPSPLEMIAAQEQQRLLNNWYARHPAPPPPKPPVRECALDDCHEPAMENPEEFCEKHWNNFKSWRR